jgi:hypothetical protein
MKIIARLPHAGLANKLLVWSKAVMFATNKGLSYKDVIVYPWIDFHPKRILSLNKDQRFYYKYFKTNDFKSFIRGLFGGCLIIEPNIDIDIVARNKYLFQEIPSKKDYFEYIRGAEPVIKEAFLNIINPYYINIANDFSDFDIAIHIRKGDFPQNLQLSSNHIISLIQEINRLSSKPPRIYIFSDGAESELSDILHFTNVTLMKNNSAIVDLLLMGKGKIIIPSIQSTFSYFASYLSDAIILRHFNDPFSKIRNNTYNEYWCTLDSDQSIQMPQKVQELLKSL